MSKSSYLFLDELNLVSYSWERFRVVYEVKLAANIAKLEEITLIAPHNIIECIQMGICKLSHWIQDFLKLNHFFESLSEQKRRKPNSLERLCLKLKIQKNDTPQRISMKWNDHLQCKKVVTFCFDNDFDWSELKVCAEEIFGSHHISKCLIVLTKSVFSYWDSWFWKPKCSLLTLGVQRRFYCL